ncbi:MAG: DEAD/DEAH box helicase [Verrucomicrobiota bacterium]
MAVVARFLMHSSFSHLGLPKPLLEAIADLGFESPSAIQEAAIPPALEGRDLVGLSETGSGKTAAFVLPALARVDLSLGCPQVLIVCPTRELAVQVCEDTHRLASRMPGLRAVPVYGGAPMDRQRRLLRQGAHIIVGTPGRLQDHLRRKTFDPSTIRLAVLDEADRMLDMGFRDEMEDLLSVLDPAHQTLFFSATMNRQVEALIGRFGNDPTTISIKRKALTVSSVEQISYEVRQRSKIEVLSRLLDMEDARLAIVFCNTKRVVDECTEALLARGYSADRLHGDITQQLRERVLRRFREGQVELLIATDVAARGLDIDEVDCVINYDLPHDPEDYVHRIGRTGRAGRKGKAISFVFGRDIYRLQSIERFIKQPIPRGKIPSQEEVEGRLTDQLFSLLQERLETGQFQDFSTEIGRLLDQGHTSTDISGALYTMLRESTGREGEKIIEDHPREPKKNRRKREGGKSDPRKTPTPEQRDDFSRNDAPRREGSPARQHSLPNKNHRGPAKGFSRDRTNGNMVRLFLNRGSSNGLRPGDIAGMLYNECRLPQGSVGRISLFPRHALIEVPGDQADKAIEGSGQARLKGKPFKLDHDRRTG